MELYRSYEERKNDHRTVPWSIVNGQPDKDKAADEVFNASRPFLKADESERVKGHLLYR